MNFVAQTERSSKVDSKSFRLAMSLSSRFLSCDFSQKAIDVSKHKCLHNKFTWI